MNCSPSWRTKIVATFSILAGVTAGLNMISWSLQQTWTRRAKLVNRSRSTHITFALNPQSNPRVSNRRCARTPVCLRDKHGIHLTAENLAGRPQSGLSSQRRIQHADGNLGNVTDTSIDRLRTIIVDSKLRLRLKPTSGCAPQRRTGRAHPAESLPPIRCPARTRTPRRVGSLAVDLPPQTAAKIQVPELKGI